MLAAVVAVALVVACCVGGVLGGAGAAGPRGDGAGFVALHSAPVSGGLTAAGAKLRAHGAPAVSPALSAPAQARGTRAVAVADTPGGGTSRQPFSLRLRL
jgi:hypothetical protein